MAEGPVFQSIVRLTNLLESLLVYVKSSMLIFFAPPPPPKKKKKKRKKLKKKEAFAVQKGLYIFSANNGCVFAYNALENFILC